MADRHPDRNTAENLNAPAQRGAATKNTEQTAGVPAVRNGNAQGSTSAEPPIVSAAPNVIAVPSGIPVTSDDDTIIGDLVPAEIDTDAIYGEEALDLSQELAGIEAAAANDRSGSGPAPMQPADSNQWRAKSVPANAVPANAVPANAVPANAVPPKLVTATVVAGAMPSQPADAGQAASETRLPRRGLRERLLMRSVPSWMISMMLHVAILMTLAAIQLEPVREAMGVLLTANAGEDTGTTLDDEFNIRGPELDAPPVATSELDQALSTPSEFTSQEIALPDTTSLASAVDMSVDVGSVSNMVESILPSSALNAASARMSSTLSGRLSGAMKSEMVERFGGNAASEKSVALALKWISDHQDRSGGWTFAHSHICRGQCKDEGDIPEAVNAATALALLPFLGAGQTHLEGNYKATVHNGLKFLISRMKVSGGPNPTGSWHESGGSMYSHGLASIVVCEAYAMTRDPDLLQPSQLAINYIVSAQDPRGGGWRYEPKQPGDTSVVGWQLMALKSGAMGNLMVPHESFRMANGFLDSMAVNNGAYYGYDQATSNIEGRQATTAVGLLCRMYLGWPKDHPGLQEGVKYLSSRGPSVDDLYYSYYATQVLRQYGGEEWTKWNTVMRDGLINAQVKEGHAAGSWYSPHGFNLKGGRLYCTAMSAMILEVYYRHMPLYSEKSSDDDFEL